MVSNNSIHEWGCTYKINYISAAAEARHLNLIPDQSLQMYLLPHGQICKLSTLLVNDMNEISKQGVEIIK